MEYYIIDELWIEIKDYLFHDIKRHGKHLKNDFYIKKYNKVMENIPRPYVPILGPRILYSGNKQNRIVKYLYKMLPVALTNDLKETPPGTISDIINMSNRIIIVSSLLPDDYNISDYEIRNDYYNYYVEDNN